MYEAYVDGNLFYSTDANDEAFAISSSTVNLEVSKSGSMQFTVIPSNQCYDKFNRMTSIVECYRNSVLIFRGRVTELSTDINRKRKIYAEGIYGFLLDSVQLPADSLTATPREVLQRLLDAHNEQTEDYKHFAIGNVTVEGIDTPRTWSLDGGDNTQESIENNLIDLLGGFTVARYENGVNYLDYMKEPDENSAAADQAVVLGLNMIDLTDSQATDDLFTVLLPLGTNNITVESITGSKFVEIPEGVAKYGRIVKSVSFNTTDKNKLLSEANLYISKWYMPETRSLTVNAVDLSQMGYSYERFKIGERVRVQSDPHELDLTLLCQAIEYDMQSDYKSQLTLVDRLEQEDSSSSTTSASSKRSSSSSGSGGGSFLKDTITRHLSEYNNTFGIVDENISLIAHKQLTIIADIVKMGSDLYETKLDMNNMKIDINDSLVEIEDDIVRIQNAYVAKLQALQADISWLNSQAIACKSLTTSEYASIRGYITVGGNVTFARGSAIKWGNYTFVRMSKTISGVTIDYIGYY